MTVRRIVALAAAAVFSMNVGGGFARAGAGAATQPTKAELMEQIQQLQTKVQALETKQQQEQIVSKADQDRAIDDVIKDAQKRSQWLQTDSALAGYEGNRFFLKSADGNFLLRPWFHMQVRDITNLSESGGDYNDNNGFELRRMKFGFDGNMFTPKLTYQINWATNRNTGVPELENAYAKYAITDEWAVAGGQLQDPFAHESLVSSKYGLAADRTLGTMVFTGGENYVQGVEVIYARPDWRAYGAFTDGARNNFNQDFRDFPTNNADFGAASRLEYKVMGDWKDYTELSPYNLKKDLLVFGGALAYTEAGNTGAFMQTADAQYNLTTGWTFYTAFIGRYINDGPISSGAPVPAQFDGYDWTAEAMVGYMINRNWQPYLRYSFLHLTQQGIPGLENDVNEFTAGVNYYWYGQAAKFTLDLVYYPNGSPVNDTGTGVLANDGENEFVLRAQFQLLL
jgi:hypothetical protein